MRVGIMFPGQGTQRPGMGGAWAGHRAWTVVERVEQATGERLSHLLLDADTDALSRTRHAQLAVFVTSMVAWEAVREELPPPIAFAGHSLGELTALVAAGSLSLEAGARLVVARADATQRAADDHQGRMAALIGADLDQAYEACSVTDECWIANDNAPGQVVVGGTPAGVTAACARAREVGVRRAVDLDVGGAFHTPLMATASSALAAALETFSFLAPSVPVIHNTDARPWSDTDWAPRLVEQVVRPVRWRESLHGLERLGATLLVEVGPGSTLCGLARRTVGHLDVHAVTGPADVPVPSA